jgi:hypothetical protein
MKKLLQLVVLISSICYSHVAYSQANSSAEQDKKKIAENNKRFFNEEEAIKQAKSKGIPASDIKGYVEFLKNDFSSKKSLKLNVGTLSDIPSQVISIFFLSVIAPCIIFTFS